MPVNKWHSVFTSESDNDDPAQSDDPIESDADEDRRSLEPDSWSYGQSHPATPVPANSEAKSSESQHKPSKSKSKIRTNSNTKPKSSPKTKSKAAAASKTGKATTDKKQGGKVAGKRPRERDDASGKEIPPAKRQKVGDTSNNPAPGTVATGGTGGQADDEVRSWREAIEKPLDTRGPSTFETALAWMRGPIPREYHHQVVGALNLPFSPYKASDSSVKISQWWGKDATRKMLQKRVHTFVGAVQQTYVRKREDELKVVRDKEAKKDLEQRERDQYLERVLRDRRLMTDKKSGPIFAILYPVQKYDVHAFSPWRPCAVAPHVEYSVNSPDSTHYHISKHKTPANPRLRGIICRVTITKPPPKSTAAPALCDRVASPGAKHAMAVIADNVRLRYVPVPDGGSVRVDPDNYASQWVDGSHDVEITIPKGQSIRLDSPGYDFVHRWQSAEYHLHEWRAWLRVVDWTKGKAKTESEEAASNRITIDDPLLQDKNGGCAMLCLLSDETTRYRTLAKRFKDFAFVTAVRALWILILDYQLLG